MKSTALAYSLPALLAYMFVFGNSSPLEKKGSIEKFGSGVNSTMGLYMKKNLITVLARLVSCFILKDFNIFS